MCLPNNQIVTIFNFKNLSDDRMEMLGYNPMFGVFSDSTNPNVFQEFEAITKTPYIVAPNSSSKYYFHFKANTSPTTPPRKNYARLRLSLYKPDSIPPPDNVNQLSIYKDFIVIARKTIHYIDVFEELIDFDSVYVYPSDSVRKQLIVQNSSEFDLVVHDVEYKRSFNAELTATIKTLPINFSKYQTGGFQHTWDLAYYPRNMGLDTAVLSIFYKPDPVNHPDSVDVRKTSIHAVGVQQDLGITKADSAKEFGFDFLDFGDLDVGQSKEIKFVVRTVGNISFGPLSQNILAIDSDKPGESFTIERRMIDSVDLQPFNSDTMVVRFTPTRSDTFRTRLVIESDITQRNIIGCPDSVRYRTIYLTGVGRAAEIASMPDEIDFGNIVVNESGDCPTRRDTLIAISNIGNLELIVKSKVYPDDSRNPFKVSPGFVTVPGRQSRFIEVTFDSIANQPGDYEAELMVVSNSPENKDTLISVLKARGIYPDTMDVRIPSGIISKPGRRVSIPILIDKNKASVARIFIDTITYNKSILFFYGARTAGTASEFAATVTAIQSDVNGALFLNIETLGSERFLERDTLIFLEFDTYLGNNITTSLHFVNPRFSDGICERILSLNKIDGSFSIDSVCGLDMKTGAQYQSGVRFKSVAPNPASSEINVSFELDEETNAEIYIYNSFGEKKQISDIKNYAKGEHSNKIILNNPAPGLYFIEIRAGVFRDVKRIIISP